MPATTNTLITLRHGFVVSGRVVIWLLEAEDRGLTFRVLPDGKLRVTPAEKVQVADDTFIREHRDVLAECVAYIERMAEAPL